MRVISRQLNFKFMPKVFIPKIQEMLLGPMPNNPPSVGYVPDKKYWAARKSLSYTLKKYYYFRNVASFKVSATTTGFYKLPPVDIGSDCGQPNPKSCYCKNIVTVTTSTQFKVTKTISEKEYVAETQNPKKNTKPPSIHELMCSYVRNDWYGKVEQKYRRTNSTYLPSGPQISDQKEKKRNCSRDYDDNGNKISENPDTSFWDYTVTFNSLLSMEVDYGFLNYLDDTNYTVQPSIDFGKTYNYMSWDTDYKENCVIKNNGTLVFVGKTITSVMYGLGAACPYEGNVNMQETWTTSSKLKLVNN